MPSWHAITKTDHLHAGHKKYDTYNHAKADTVAPLLSAELSQALAYYPIAFVQNPSTDDTHSYQLVTLHSLQPGLNLYVNSNGQWLAPYVPSHYRSYPFKLIPNQAKDNELTLCYDKDAELLHENALADDVPIFSPDGELSQDMQNLMSFLQQCETNRQLTQNLVNQLAEAQLIQPWLIQTKASEEAEQPQTVQGLFKIDEDALKTRAPETLSQLAQSGALGLAYAQLYSQARLKDFQARYQHHAQQQPNAQTAELDLDKFFGEDDDSFKF